MTSNTASLDQAQGPPVASTHPADVMKKKETLNFRVSAEFKRKLIEEAKKERRSLTNYLETTLTNLWDQQESGIGKKGEGKKG